VLEEKIAIHRIYSHYKHGLGKVVLVKCTKALNELPTRWWQ
jgi:hypothetical protein